MNIVLERKKLFLSFSIHNVAPCSNSRPSKPELHTLNYTLSRSIQFRDPWSFNKKVSIKSDHAWRWTPRLVLLLSNEPLRLIRALKNYFTQVTNYLFALLSLSLPSSLSRIKPQSRSSSNACFCFRAKEKERIRRNSRWNTEQFKTPKSKINKLDHKRNEEKTTRRKCFCLLFTPLYNSFFPSKFKLCLLILYATSFPSFSLFYHSVVDELFLFPISVSLLFHLLLKTFSPSFSFSGCCFLLMKVRNVMSSQTQKLIVWSHFEVSNLRFRPSFLFLRADRVTETRTESKMRIGGKCEVQ